MTEIDELPVSGLADRYGVHRSQVYNRLDSLKKRNPKLVPHRRGRSSYVSAEILGYLDGMAALIEQGNTNEEAADAVLGILPVDSRPDSLPDTRQFETSELAIVSSEPEPKPFDKQEFLEKLRTIQEIADNDWLPSSSELAAILDLKSLPSGPSFERYGFQFSKAGRNGPETSWRIKKLKI